jgi:hypothetical protein
MTEFNVVANHKRPTLLGLPAWLAFTIAGIVAGAFWMYTAWWAEAPLLFNDSGSYMKLADDLSNFSIDRLHDRTPGYSLLLLVTGSSELPTRALFLSSLLMYFATVWMLATVLHSTGVRPAVVLAFVIVLLLPPNVEHTAMVMTETVAQFMLVAGFVCLFHHLRKPRTAWLVGSSLAFGYAALSRPTFQLIAAVAALVVILVPACWRGSLSLRNGVWKTALGVVCGTVVLVGGYSLVNYRATGYFGLTPFLAYNLTTRTVKFIERLPDEYASVREVLIHHRDAVLVKRGSDHDAYNYISAARKRDLTNVTGLTGLSLANYMLHVNVALIRSAPLRYAQEVLRTIPSFWFPTYGAATSYSREMQAVWAIVHILIMAGFFLQLIVISGLGIYELSARLVHHRAVALTPSVMTSRLEVTAYVLCIAFIGYTMILSCALGVGDPRYRIPVEGMILLTTVMGFDLWQRALTSALSPAAADRHRTSAA